MEISIYVLIVIFFVVVFLILLAYYIGKKQRLRELRKQIADKQRDVIKGKVSEMFAPHLEGFPFKASECKFIGDPIDYLVFEGLDKRDVKAIHLVEVKSGKSELSKHQRKIKELVDQGKVKFHLFRFFSK